MRSVTGKNTTRIKINDDVEGDMKMTKDKTNQEDKTNQKEN
jgi:hypothetical protein